jgi:hypothetical protein
VADNSVFTTEFATGRATRLTTRSEDRRAPRPEACVLSPNGRRIAYVKPVVSNGQLFNQIFVTESP